jgi:hypothetical protein
MTLKEMKLKVLALIEELNPDNALLTDDPDIQAKINHVTNQILFELIRLKKIPKYVEMEVSKGDIIDFATIEQECGYEVYQINLVGGVSYESKASGTIIKIRENGTAELDISVYPERITDKTKDNYEFEVSADVLEIMPYGIAADLLKSDVSAEYGKIYAERYEAMKQLLDPRYQMPSFYVEGGVSI